MSESSSPIAVSLRNRNLSSRKAGTKGREKKNKKQSTEAQLEHLPVLTAIDKKAFSKLTPDQKMGSI